MARYFSASSIVLLVLALAQPVSATDYYVDNSCTFSGNGLVHTCAAAAGAPGAFTDVQTALDAASVPGDTVYIKNGNRTYVTTYGKGLWQTGFHITHSGTAANPITIRNYPGHSPLLANGPDGNTDHLNADRATITAEGQEYIHITGFRVRGIIFVYGTGSEKPGNVIDHMEVTQGYCPTGDGNWSGIWLQGQTGIWVHHNNVHDIVMLANNGNSPGSPGGIRLFTSVNGIYEYNTVTHAEVGFEDKQDSVGNTVRYNLFQNVRVGWRSPTQSGSTYRATSGTQIYQNVFDATGWSSPYACLKLYDNPIGDLRFSNNVCHGFPAGVDSDKVGASHLRLFNNIFSGVTYYQVVYWNGSDPDIEDYNAYTSGRPWYVAGASRSTLADVRSATTFDDGSQALSSFGYVSSGDYHLTAGSPCRSAGRVGGVPGGAAIDQGAYVSGVTCVGHTCDGSGAAAPPRPPTAVRIVG